MVYTPRNTSASSETAFDVVVVCKSFKRRASSHSDSRRSPSRRAARAAASPLYTKIPKLHSWRWYLQSERPEYVDSYILDRSFCVINRKIFPGTNCYMIHKTTSLCFRNIRRHLNCSSSLYTLPVIPISLLSRLQPWRHWQKRLRNIRFFRQ